MKKNSIVFLLFLGVLLVHCNEKEVKEKGFRISESSTSEVDSVNSNGVNESDKNRKTKSVDLLATANPNVKVIPIFLVNYNEKQKLHFTGSNAFYYNYNDDLKTKGNSWKSIIPGFEALYGYNLVNIFHFDQQKNEGKNLFEKSVLIKTLYFPTKELDSLKNKPIKRNYYMVSVYDQDTNKDNYLNIKDLRRFYFFDENGINKEAIVPLNYSVIGAFFDETNDFLYIDAKEDVNKDGKINKNETVTLFYLDLNNPKNKGIVYKNK